MASTVLLLQVPPPAYHLLLAACCRPPAACLNAPVDIYTLAGQRAWLAINIGVRPSLPAPCLAAAGSMRQLFDSTSARFTNQICA